MAARKRKAATKQRTRAKKSVAAETQAVTAPAKPAGKPEGRPFAPGHDPRRNVTKPGPGRPPNHVRLAFQEALKDRVLPRALAVLDKSEDGDLQLRAIKDFAEVGFNEKMRTVRMNADSRAQAAAAAQSGANASVQVHLSGGPTGVERPSQEVRPARSA